MSSAFCCEAGPQVRYYWQYAVLARWWRFSPSPLVGPLASRAAKRAQGTCAAFSVRLTGTNRRKPKRAQKLANLAGARRPPGRAAAAFLRTWTPLRLLWLWLGCHWVVLLVLGVVPLGAGGWGSKSLGSGSWAVLTDTRHTTHQPLTADRLGAGAGAGAAGGHQPLVPVTWGVEGSRGPSGLGYVSHPMPYLPTL